MTTTQPQHQAAIGMGSNLGDSQTILENALTTLDQTDGIQLLKVSSWYRTKPLGPPQPDYLNGCALLGVTLSPQALLKALQDIEQKFDRVRTIHWGPRTLDLDILLFDELIVDTPTLKIPRPEMRERNFVLVPLAEIGPDLVDPVSGQTILQLREAVDCSDIVLYQAKA